jgi:hypothetical protein
VPNSSVHPHLDVFQKCGRVTSHRGCEIRTRKVGRVEMGTVGNRDEPYVGYVEVDHDEVDQTLERMHVRQRSQSHRASQ